MKIFKSRMKPQILENLGRHLHFRMASENIHKSYILQEKTAWISD